jgi:hypothetical protein
LADTGVWFFQAGAIDGVMFWSNRIMFISADLLKPRRRWEDNIKMDLQEVGGGGGYWMELAQDRDRWRALLSTVKNLRVP